MILSSRPCSTTVPVTRAPSTAGVPTRTSSPPTTSASNSTVSPASFAIEGTRTVPPSSTRNCLPPDLMIA
jgi:hypothetical protein